MVLLRYRWFYLSCLAAFTAGHMVNYTVILYAQEVIGSDLLSGIGFGLCFGPPLVLGWYAGVLCDRHAPGRLIHAAQALFVLAAALLAVADQAVAGPAQRVPWLLLAALLAGVAWSFVAPARMAALGQVAREADLKPASVAFNLFVMLGFGLGPLTLAALRSQAGWPGVLGAIAALFVLSSLWLLRVPTQARSHRPAALREEVAEGFRAVAQRPLLRQLLLAATTGYLAMGPMTVLLPKLATAQLHLGELQRGAFLGVLALALISGGVLALVLTSRVHHGRSILAATALAGLGLGLLGGAPSAAAAVAWLSLVGVAGGMALSLIVAGIQAQAPDAQRGRVVSLYTLISQVVPAASGVVAGALVQAWGVAMALHLCGAALLAATAFNAFRMRALRQHRG